MKLLTNAFVGAVVAMSMIGCSNGDDNGAINTKNLKEFTPISFSRSETETIERTQNFAWNLLRAVDEQEPGNFMISPLSTALNLSMLANGAEGETLDQIIEALDIDADNVADINSYAKKLMAGITDVDNSTDIQIANALFFRQNINIFSDFKNSLSKWYDADVLSIGSNQTGVISNWISNKTKGKITNLLSSEEEANAEFAVVNALYFDAIWESPFYESATIQDVFHSKGGDCKAYFMCKYETIDIWQDEKFAIGRLDFGNSAFSIYFLLPHEEYQLDDVMPTLDDDLISSLERESLLVKLRVPKFKLDSRVDLINPLKSCGIVDAFDGNNANFGLLSDQDTYINLMRQGCNFSIDETGVVAVVATASTGETTAPGPIVEDGEFYIDRPFIFMIRENSSNMWLFMGKVENIY